MQNPREYLTEDKFAEVLKKLPPLGLKLDKAKFFMDSNQEKISHKQRGNLATQIGHSDLKSLPEKEARKASKIVTFLLKIGSWQRVSRNEEDVVAKCYFSKRRFVWEILENGLKKKIEIQWEYILSMRVVIIEYQPGILEVELNQQPMFFGETDPEPKKHSRWKHIADFTDGQATICRKHFLKFPPGAFDKHLKKLLRFEPRFLQMCQSTFPRLQNPYFHSDLHHVGENISFECFGNGPEMNSFQQSPYSRDFNNTLSFGCNGNDPEMN
ncbi:uncharacterized protein LOC21384258, partial [Morus notabilis]|uniref:uncharacterized protein LOC21384258 n=1 Tax=Morus notabilis TaxID=981085 RepID=UPI000CECEB0F